METRRFAFVVPSPFPLRWSPPAGEDFLLEPPRLLADEGHRVEVLTTRANNQAANERIGAVEVTRFESRGRLVGHIARSRYDVIHAHSDFLPALLTGLTAYRSKTLLTRHSYVLPSLRLRKRAQIALMNRFDRVVAVSPYEMKVYREAGVAPAKLLTLPYAINTGFFRQGGNASQFRAQFQIDADSRVILFIANLRTVKNPLTVFRALGEVRKHTPQAKLVVVGKDFMESDSSPSARTLANQLGVGDAVIFADWLSAESLRDAMSAAEVVVNSSFNEGLALAISEAAAAGKPLCLPAIGSFQSVFGENALYHAPEDHLKLAQNILCYFGNQELRSKHVEANQQRVAEFDLDQIRARWRTLYNSL